MKNPTNNETMGFLIFSAVLGLSFTWMWNRNKKAIKTLNRLRRFSKAGDDVIFEEWMTHTRRRMTRADIAATMITIAPMIAWVGALSGTGGITAAPQISIPFNICVWGSLIMALRSIAAGRKADAIAKNLSMKKGVSWLASKNPTRNDQTIDHDADEIPSGKIPHDTDAHEDLSEHEDDAREQHYSTYNSRRSILIIKSFAVITLSVLSLKTLINPSFHVLLPDVADSGILKGQVVGFRYIKKTWWGIRNETFEQIRFSEQEPPQYYDPKTNKWLEVPSNAYADANDEEVEPWFLSR